MADKELEDYRGKLVRLASQTYDHKIRNQLLEMAREWMEADRH